VGGRRQGEREQDLHHRRGRRADVQPRRRQPPHHRPVEQVDAVGDLAELGEGPDRQDPLHRTVGLQRRCDHEGDSGSVEGEAAAVEPRCLEIGRRPCRQHHAECERPAEHHQELRHGRPGRGVPGQGHREETTHGQLRDTGVCAHVDGVGVLAAALDEHDRRRQDHDRPEGDADHPAAFVPEPQRRGDDEREDEVALFLDGEAPEVLQRRRGAVEGRRVVRPGRDEPPVGDVGKGRPDLRRQLPKLVLGADERREDRDRSQRRQRCRHEPPEPAGPEPAERDVADALELEDQQARDEEPRQREEGRHAEEPALGHLVEARQIAGLTDVVQQHRTDGEPPQPVERGLVAQRAPRRFPRGVGHRMRMASISSGRPGALSRG